MSLEKLFDSYIQSGLFLKGWSPKTAMVYRRAFRSFLTAHASTHDIQGPQAPSKNELELWVIWMRQKGMSPAGCNIYIRALNAFGSWLREEGHVSTAIRLKQIRVPETELVIFSDTQIKTILAHRPKRFNEVRVWTLINVLVDTGLVLNDRMRARILAF